ncbi:MAG TPA: hypothetical protein VGK40_07580 [Verrucomicrobiae bacterium]|jgi:hypothetical protein
MQKTLLDFVDSSLISARPPKDSLMFAQAMVEVWKVRPSNPPHGAAFVPAS